MKPYGQQRRINNLHKNSGFAIPPARILVNNSSIPTNALKSSLVAYWGLADLTDSTGNGYMLTNVGGVDFETSPYGGMAVIAQNPPTYNGGEFPFPPGRYLSWSGSSIPLSGDWSVSGWVYSLYNLHNTPAQYPFSLISNINNFSGLACGIIGSGSGPGQVAFSVSSPGYDGVSFGSGTIPANTWTHIVFTRSIGVVTVYVNGTASGSVSYATNNSTTAIDIGGTRTGGWTCGDFSSTGLWTRGLTDLEVAQLYNGGAGLPYSSFNEG